MARMRRSLTWLILATVVPSCRSRSRESSAGAPTPIAVEIPAAAGALAPFLRSDGDGVLATWLEPVLASSHRLRFARWQRGGWSTPVTVVESSGIVANWADVPTVARGGDGALVASWADASGDGEAYDAVVARSTDAGATWTRLGTLHADRTPAEHGFVSMTADARGVRAFWLDGRDTGTAGGATALRTALVGAGIEGEAVVDDRVCDCCATSAAMSADGPIVAFRDRSADEIRDVAVARSDAAAAQWEPSSVHADGWKIAGCPVNGPVIATRGREVVAAWYTYAGDTHRVRAAFSMDGGAHFAPAIEVDVPASARAPLGRVGLALDDDGSALVSWVASAREDATVLVRRIAADGRRGDEVAIARTTAGRDAGFPRLARAGDDLLFVWTEPASPSHLRAARLSRTEIPALGGAGTASAVIAPTVVRPGRGDPSPAIAAATLAGARVELASLREHVVMVNLWATWCEPCRKEMPDLAAIQETYRARGLVVVGLDVDRGKRDDEIAAFAARRGATYTIWRDVDDRASTALGISTYPVTLLIDRGGTIAWRRDGAITRDDPELLAAIDAALAR